MSVHVLGGHQTDFARDWTKEGLGVYDLLRESALGALEATRIDPAEVEVAHVGNLAAELFCGQAQLGGMVAAVDPAWAMLPTSRHEAACASGSVAALAAMADIEAGRYDLALVTGVELMRGVGAREAAQHLGSAAWAGREAVGAAFPWPRLFAEIADVVAERDGLDGARFGACLARISELNHANALRNPLAQTRNWSFPEGCFGPDDTLNPTVEGRLRKYDCGRITDGAASVLIASARYAGEYARRHGRSLDDLPRITGWGHRSAPMLLADKMTLAEGQPYLFPHLRQAALDAYRRAGVAGPADLDVIETHDCFTITEYVALDHLGLTPPGQAHRAIESGAIEPGGSLPVNPSGGLIGLGHPVGATGVRMLLDAARQVTGEAGDCQVEGARAALTLNIGGSCTTVAIFIVSR
ncbi:acetyl-CoA acetyltransferase [Nonomuraea lactucae]|uniref:acetyl-CoA acetyltransferase n=1 Tax=Nonomuraea lactucae TaxID=2249762 RepID=UPI000DE23547|nr:acetyl-CoA acetyltransferase [Nonomuraea lactucae]